MTSCGDGKITRKVLIIDLSDFEKRKEEIAGQLHYAASEVGFFYIKGHGVPQDLIDRAFAAGSDFQDLDRATKEEHKWIPDRYLGWRSHDNLETVTGNRLWEWFSFGRYGTGGYDVKEQKFLGSKWPEPLGDDWRDLSLTLQEETHNVALKILQCFAIALGRGEHYFSEPFDINSEENPSFMAWNYYPPIPEDAKLEDLPARLHAHADMDVITLLYQRPEDRGLEIAPGKEIDHNPELDKIGNIWDAVPTAKSWTALDPIPGCITVNIGDGLTYWTDGLYKSTYHRVRAPKEGDHRGARMSMPYFVNPKLNYVFQGPEKKYPPLTGFDLLSKTGNAYEARKNDATKAWQKKAYVDYKDVQAKDHTDHSLVKPLPRDAQTAH